MGRRKGSIACTECGTWYCLECNFIRKRANRAVTQSCAWCGNTHGFWEETKHRNPQTHVD